MSKIAKGARVSLVASLGAPTSDVPGRVPRSPPPVGSVGTVRSVGQTGWLQVRFDRDDTGPWEVWRDYVALVPA